MSNQGIASLDPHMSPTTRTTNVIDIDPWAAAINSWLLALRAAGQRPQTVQLRAYQLRRVSHAMRQLSPPRGPWDTTTGDLVAWIGVQDWGRESLRSWRAGLRGFYGWAVDEELAARNPARGLKPIRPTDPDPHPTPEDVLGDALIVADPRVHLMLRLGGLLGMRRGEIACAHLEDLVRSRDGWTMIVHGKGGKLRRVPCPDLLAAEIRRLEATHARGWLFPGAVDGHLSAPWVGRLLSRTLRGAWTGHSLRHRFGTAAHEVERDLAVVQELMGHADVRTTRRYVRVPTERLRATVNAVAAM